MNRSRHHSYRPYSASVFRLRGTNSSQAFVQEAQAFFSNISTSPTTSNTSKSSRSKSTDKLRTEAKSTTNNKTKAKHLSVINEPSLSSSKKKTTSNHVASPEPTTTSTTIRRVTRAEFDPGKTLINSVSKNHNHRTYSETTTSSDSQTTNSTREVLLFTETMDHVDDDDKMTTVSNNFSSEQITELMRELKELRNEIAALKLDKRIPPMTRSMSTSPLAVDDENSKQTTQSSTVTSSSSFPDTTSQSEVDAETQTDFSALNQRRRHLTRKNKKTMIGSGTIVTLKKQKMQNSNGRNGRTFSNSSTNTISDQEGK